MFLDLLNSMRSEFALVVLLSLPLSLYMYRKPKVPHSSKSPNVYLRRRCETRGPSQLVSLQEANVLERPGDFDLVVALVEHHGNKVTIKRAARA